MVKILMMSAKTANRALEIKVTASHILSMMSPTKFCHMTQMILRMWSHDQSLVTLALV